MLASTTVHALSCIPSISIIMPAFTPSYVNIPSDLLLVCRSYSSLNSFCAISGYTFIYWRNILHYIVLYYVTDNTDIVHSACTHIVSFHSLPLPSSPLLPSSTFLSFLLLVTTLFDLI